MDDRIEPQFAEPFKAWKSAQGPDAPAANAAFLKTLHPVIEGAVKTHVGDPHPIIMSQARRMALGAMRTYDPSRGRVSTHLYNHLQGLKRVNRKQTQMVAVPERVAMERAGLDASADELRSELGREPSDAELADRSGISYRRMKRVRSYRPAVAEGQMEDEETGSPYSAGRASRSGAAAAWADIVYHELPPHEQKVMEWTLGLNGHPRLANHEIAARLGRTPGAISQAKLRIQARLDAGDEVSLL